MSLSKEEKRWIVVGIAMNKVAVPVLRDAVKQGMDTYYAQLDNHCQSHAPFCTLQSLTLGLVKSHRLIFHKMKFKNINDNEKVHGKSDRNYNYAITDSIDLAKLYLPDYLAQFSAFNESLDMAAILRLLGSNNFVLSAVFFSDTQNSADDVRENVRNKWGHFNETEWTDTFFHDCFDKMKTLVKSLKLTADVEKKKMAEFAEWQTKGCQLMGNNEDRELLQSIQCEVKELVNLFTTIKSQLGNRFPEAMSEEGPDVLPRLQSFETQLTRDLYLYENGWIQVLWWPVPLRVRFGIPGWFRLRFPFWGP